MSFLRTLIMIRFDEKGYGQIWNIIHTLETRPKKILELGCGHGILVEMLLGDGYDAYGLDKDGGFLVERAVEENRLVKGDAQHIQNHFKDQFDGVVSNSLLSVMGLNSSAGPGGVGWVDITSLIEEDEMPDVSQDAENIHKSTYNALISGGFAIHKTPDMEKIIAPSELFNDKYKIIKKDYNLLVLQKI